MIGVFWNRGARGTHIVSVAMMTQHLNSCTSAMEKGSQAIGELALEPEQELR